MNIASLSVSGLITLDMHALNNEGAEGNHLQTRQVQIVDEQGDIHAVNAISGDMLKHIQSEHLYHLAREEGLPLCNPCAVFDANRIVADTEFSASFEKEAKDSAILSRVLQTCLLDDAEGILITSEIGGKKRSIGRKSVIEFGWVVGRPAATRTEAYFHVKYVPEGRGKGSGAGGENLGQNIFHRPASSGRYAVVVNLDLYRLGRNDISLEYALEPTERARRVRALLKSLLFTFIKPTGAQRNTQNPHIVAFEGCLSYSTSTIPAPTVSALNSRYREEIHGVASVLNRFGSKAVEVLDFDSQSSFAEQMYQIIESVQV